MCKDQKSESRIRKYRIEKKLTTDCFMGATEVFEQGLSKANLLGGVRRKNAN